METEVDESNCDYENTPFIRTVVAKGDQDRNLKAVGFVMPVYGNCNEKIAVQMSGIVTVVNNSRSEIHAGSPIKWSNPNNSKDGDDWELSNGRARRHPSDRDRYVAVLHEATMDTRLVGTALTSAKRGQTYSLHVQLGG